MFCKVWNQQTEHIEDKNISASVYTSICEIDEALISLVEKISECNKEITKSLIYDKSPLSETHNSIIERNHNKHDNV